MKNMLYKAWSIFLICISVAHAQSDPTNPVVKMTMKKVIVETFTTVSVGPYTPAIAVKASTRAAAKYFTPEAAAFALFSAMAQGDYDWWFSVWSVEARALMTKHYQDTGRKQAEIVAGWQGILKDNPVFLTGKAEYARKGVNYALIRYKKTGMNLTSEDIKTHQVTKLGTEFENTLAFKFNNGRWEAVQDLATDPVFHNSVMLWDDTKSEVRISKPAD